MYIFLIAICLVLLMRVDSKIDSNCQDFSYKSPTPTKPEKRPVKTEKQPSKPEKQPTKPEDTNKFKSKKDFTETINNLILQGKEQGFSTKDISDKWHTFDELYYHRMILFSVILNNNKNVSWKSKLHHDGTMFEDSFICGIQTSEGQYTYHYHLEHWDMFNVKELENAPEYDGHKPSDITRLITLYP